MTRRSISWPVVLVVLSAGVPSLTAADLDEVIAEHVEARGGDRWDEIVSMQITGQYTAFSETYPFTKQHKRDLRYRMEFSTIGREGIIGFDGETAWSMSGEDPSLVSGLDRQVLMREVDFATPLFDYAERGFEAKLLGEVDFDGMNAIGIELTRPDESVETWYLDPKTYLERGLISPGTDYLGPTPRTTFFEDFRDVEGVKMPFYVESQWLTRNRVTEIEEVSLNVEIDDELFVMPPPQGMGDLEAMIGTWTVTIKQGRGPEEEWEETQRESTIDSKMRGALLEESYDLGDGTPVVRTFSYDKYNKRYRSTQFDGLRNQMNVQEGVMDENGRLTVSNVESGTSFSSRGTTTHSRVSYFDLSDTGFKVEYESSTDGGETWNLVARASYSRKAE